MKHGPSPTVTDEMAAEIKALLAKGFYSHEIAAKFGINQGRVSEIKNGKTHTDVIAKDQTSFDFESLLIKE